MAHPGGTSTGPSGPRIKEEDIQIGAQFAYKGDRIPFESPFLRNKFKDRATHLLPHFEDVNLKIGSGETDREWQDVPTKEGELFVVHAIERDRVGKGGRKVPGELIVLSYVRDDIKRKVGLKIADIIAKFTLFDGVKGMIVGGSLEEAARLAAESEAWKSKIAEDGW